MTKQRLGFTPCGNPYDNVGYKLAKDGQVVCAVCDPRQVHYPYRDGELPWLGGHYLTGEGGERVEETYKLHEAIAAFEDGTPLCCSECGGSMLWRDIDNTASGDYSGHGTVERSNCLSIASHLQGLEEGKDEPDWPEENKHWREETGPYGFLVLQVQLMAESKDVHPAIQDVEAALANYPLFDDDHHSEYEHELEEEAWVDDVRRGFWKALGKRASVLSYEEQGLDRGQRWPRTALRLRTVETFEQRWERLDNDIELTAGVVDRVLREWFYTLVDQSNAYWVHEGPTSAYIDVDKVCKAATAWDLRELLGDIAEAMEAK